MASSRVVNKPPSRTAPAAGRAGRAAAVLGGVRRTTVLLVLAAVVLSFNMVAGNGSAEDRPASFSEIAQTDARAAAVDLARQAQGLAESPPGDFPEELSRREAKVLLGELSSQAEILAGQSALLTRTGSLRRGSPSSAGPQAGPVSGAEAPSAAAYVRSLAASARSSLNAALRADAGTARLLASTGAAQQVLALRAADAAGLEAPELWEPAAAAGGTNTCTNAPSGAPGGDTRVSGAPPADGGTTVPDAAAALQSAIDAEYGAAYAYEVAMARTSETDSRADLEAAREDHLAAGARGVQLLPELCLPALTPAPAYSLPPSFSADASGNLADLEASLPAVYADLAALGTGNTRGWAIQRLAELSTKLYLEDNTVPASPGLDAEPEGLPWAAGTA